MKETGGNVWDAKRELEPRTGRDWRKKPSGTGRRCGGWKESESGYTGVSGSREGEVRINGGTCVRKRFAVSEQWGGAIEN